MTKWFIASQLLTEEKCTPWIYSFIAWLQKDETLSLAIFVFINTDTQKFLTTICLLYRNKKMLKDFSNDVVRTAQTEVSVFCWSFGRVKIMKILCKLFTLFTIKPNYSL